MRRCHPFLFQSDFCDEATARLYRQGSRIRDQPGPLYTPQDFVTLCQKALQLFLPPNVTNFTLPELAIMLKRSDKYFSPKQYGSPDLRSLLQHCKFVGFARGRYHVVRDSHSSRRPIIMDNSTWSYVEPMSPQSNRAMSGPNAPFGDPYSPRPRYRPGSHTALSLKLSRMTMKKPKAKRNHEWNAGMESNDNTLHSIESELSPPGRDGFGSSYRPEPEFDNSKFYKDDKF